MEISVVPLGLSRLSLGENIAEVVQYLKSEKIPHELTDMGTLVYGPIATLLQVAAALHEIPFKQGIQRVLTHISIDDRRDKEVLPGDKQKSVRTRLK